MNIIKDNLLDEPGFIWIMIKLDDKWFRDDQDRIITNAIAEFVLANDIGELDGESSGAGAMDINFTVHSKQKAAQEIDDFIKKLDVNFTYYIADRYSPLFEL